jgi:hypothetical protein
MCFLQNSGRVPIERQTIDSRSADETDLLAMQGMQRNSRVKIAAFQLPIDTGAGDLVSMKLTNRMEPR